MREEAWSVRGPRRDCGVGNRNGNERWLQQPPPPQEPRRAPDTIPRPLRGDRPRPASAAPRPSPPLLGNARCVPSVLSVAFRRAAGGGGESRTWTQVRGRCGTLWGHCRSCPGPRSAGGDLRPGRGRGAGAGAPLSPQPRRPRPGRAGSAHCAAVRWPRPSPPRFGPAITFSLLC